MVQPHKSHKAKLDDVHRAFIVRELACFASPKEATEALKQEFGIEISPQAAEHYDPTKAAGKQSSKKWHEPFRLAREAFLEQVQVNRPGIAGDLLC